MYKHTYKYTYYACFYTYIYVYKYECVSVSSGDEMFWDTVYGLKNVTSFFIILRSGLFPGVSTPLLPGRGEKKAFQQMYF